MPPTQAEWDEMWDVVHELQEKIAWNEKAILAIIQGVETLTEVVKKLS